MTRSSAGSPIILVFPNNTVTLKFGLEVTEHFYEILQGALNTDEVHAALRYYYK